MERMEWQGRRGALKLRDRGSWGESSGAQQATKF